MLMISEPIQLLAGVPLADINLQMVIEYPLLLIVLQIVEIPSVKGVVAFSHTARLRSCAAGRR